MVGVDHGPASGALRSQGWKFSDGSGDGIAALCGVAVVVQQEPAVSYVVGFRGLPFVDLYGGASRQAAYVNQR